jgi:hypothetical protein
MQRLLLRCGGFLAACRSWEYDVWLQLLSAAHVIAGGCPHRSSARSRPLRANRGTCRDLPVLLALLLVGWTLPGPPSFRCVRYTPLLSCYTEMRLGC